MYPNVVAALFAIARTWKQPRCPSTDEWIKERWYVYTVEYHSAIKMNTFESVLMNLETIIQSEVSQKEKSIIYQCVYMESRKMVLMELFARQQWRHRHREQTYGPGGMGGGRRGWDVWRE